MDEFLNQNYNENNNETPIGENVSDNEQQAKSEANFESVPQENIPIYNPVNYTPVTPINNYKPMSTGLKVFCLSLAAVIALTAASLGGYFLGKNSVSLNSNKRPVKIQLEAQPEDGKEMTAAAVYEQVDESVVGITIYNSSGKGSQASGIIYSKDGYIVTNDHIYSEIPNAKFKIHTHSGKEYDAKYVAGDLVSDLAVLKIENSSLKPATFANSDDLYMGQKVVAIGRPKDATDVSSITSGIISATNRRVSNSSNYPARLIQTDSPINPGSSGGALVNMYGQVVGVTSSKLAGVEYEGVGYAIPTTVMKRIVEELIAEGRVVSRAKLGITYVAINSVTAEIKGIANTGLQVESVATDSDLYGKIAKGDMITQINGSDISTDDMVLDIIENCSAGDKITVTVITGKNETKTFTVALRANIGESSYSTKMPNTSSSDSSSNGGTFNFPFGE